MIYDSIVIGKGLIGSAAAKYLSLSGRKVAVIGPDEPLNLNEGIVFSSHYDQARIQRITGTDTTWTLLNQQSAAQYPLLQKESKINFHTPAGCLYVNPDGTDTYLEKLTEPGKQFNSAYHFFEHGNLLNKTFPDFHFPERSQGMYEGPPSGFIDPGLLIKAQLEVFKKNYGTIVNDIAEDISYETESIKLITLKGKVFRAKNVLVAAGAFTNFLNLLNKKLALRLKSETTILAKVSKEEATRLNTLPSLLYEIENPEIQNIYLIKPVQYPDGEYYLKLGANIPEDIYFETLQEIQNWFRSGESDANLKRLQHALNELMPGLRVKGFATKRCIVSLTKHGKPYIGAVNEKGLIVAAGDNGYSAMCSDALGRIASHLLIKKTFPEEYNEKDFLPVYKSSSPTPSRREGN